MEETWKYKKILIVEDNVSNYKLLEAILKSRQISFDWATDGKKALEYFENNHYDMIFMDIQLPELDGYEVTQKIRSMNQTIPIIAITAFAILPEKNKGLISGCTEYISKPFILTTILRVLKQYLS